MALETLAAGHSTYQGRVEVRDPNAAAGALLADYILVPGVASFTLPDEQAATTDVALLDGVTKARGFANVGTITIPIGTLLPSHATHKLLESKKAAGGRVMVRCRVQRQLFGSVLDAVNVAAAARIMNVMLTASAGITADQQAALDAELEPKRRSVTSLLRRGQRVMLSVGSGANMLAKAGDQAPAAMQGVVAGALPANATAGPYTIETLREHEDPVGTGKGYVASFKVSPANGAAAIVKATMEIVMPAIEWADILCDVTGLGKGTAESAALVTGSNLILEPVSQVAPPTIRYSAFAEADFNN